MINEESYRRRLEILKEADRRFGQLGNFDSFVEAFKLGAEWADEHPNVSPETAFVTGSQPGLRCIHGVDGTDCFKCYPQPAEKK